MSRSMYRPISQVGSNAYSPVNNPLTYCLDSSLDQRFLHGGHADTMGQHSKPCQAFLSQYCAEKWDGFCEIASQNRTMNLYPNNIKRGAFGLSGNTNLTAGDILIHNTAAQKYLVSMANCRRKYEPFDPLVPTSPLISYWVKNADAMECVPAYGVDPKTIDGDVVMDKILARPVIALDILINIYNTMKRHGTLGELVGTKLGRFYDSDPAFVAKGGLGVREK